MNNQNDIYHKVLSLPYKSKNKNNSMFKILIKHAKEIYIMKIRRYTLKEIAEFFIKELNLSITTQTGIQYIQRILNENLLSEEEKAEITKYELEFLNEQMGFSLPSPEEISQIIEKENAKQ